jgi:hypothetical protein
MMPRRAAVLLALLSSASNQTLLSALTVGSLNAGLLSSASAATCVTGVTSTFANVVSGVNGTPGTTVVTAVSPTFANAVTGVQTTPGSFLTGASLGTTSTNVVNGVSGQTGTAVTAVTPTVGNALTSVNTTTTSGSFLTGATLNQVTGTAVTGVTSTTGTVTGITPGTNNPNLRTIAFDRSNPLGTNAVFGANNSTIAGNEVPRYMLERLLVRAKRAIEAAPLLDRGRSTAIRPILGTNNTSLKFT